ncbi:uncharacterized protein PAC_01148 [Phialocephala subalpina]|uniref:Uncharacterized protein n=1 Tax=Phialocephala subalpina TaxID=576137 RepID=A0A1L7WER7_9HELO|nr:uncharacterized protein PAC_01148 [Phialocephala subalpina]
MKGGNWTVAVRRSLWDDSGRSRGKAVFSPSTQDKITKCGFWGLIRRAVLRNGRSPTLQRDRNSNQVRGKSGADFKHRSMKERFGIALEHWLRKNNQREERR